MRPLGWLFLTASWAVLTYVTVWCFVKILQAPFQSEERRPQAALESPPHANEVARIVWPCALPSAMYPFL
jgi:hypothetical protein